MKDSSIDRADIMRWVEFCLARAVLVSFKFDSLFSAVFQSEHGTRTIEATLVIGSSMKVSIEAVGGGPALTAQSRRSQAFHLMALVGHRVRSVSLVLSEISIEFEEKGLLEISGVSQLWDFAWHLGVPAREVYEESVSVECAADGELFCSWEREWAADGSDYP